MKKIISLTLSAIVLLSITACGNNAELERLRKENEELKQQVGEETQAETHTQGTSDTAKQTIEVGQPFSVNTENGQYIVTVTGANIADWRERSGGTITNLNLLLNYTVENVDFSNEAYPGCMVDSNFFYVYDDNGTMLDTAGTSYDASYPDTILPGFNGNFNLVYDVDTAPQYIDVILHRYDENYNDKVLGQLRVDVQQ